MNKVEFVLNKESASVMPITFDSSKCVGCNRCVQVCQCDVLYPNEEVGKTPVVMFPGECYYCGACVMVCTHEGAIHFKHPIMNQAKFVDVK